jgi:hypothetical protein
MQWLQHYDQGVPDTLSPYPERTLLDDLAEEQGLIGPIGNWVLLPAYDKATR